MHTTNQLVSLPPVRLNGCTREALRSYFINAWDLYEMLFRSIRSDESLYLKTDPRRNPLIFYLGHTAAFYINKLRMAGLIDAGLHAHYDRLFAVGVDPKTADELDASQIWPAAEVVRDYRRQVREIVLSVIENADFPEIVEANDPHWSIFMGIEHDRIHFETSSVLIRQYDVDLVQKPEGWTYAPTSSNVPENGTVDIPGGTVMLGKPEAHPVYGWDNEYGQLRVDVAPFSVQVNMISNAEYRAFVDAGGYQNREYWTEDGWKWREKYQFEHPIFWIPKGTDYLYRAMFDLLPMPQDWPVEVSCHEAEAYCKWRGDEWRLMTEAEWKLLTADAPEVDGDPIYADCHNLNFRYGSPTPVGMMKGGCTPHGVNDVYGNVWDWLSDDFYPLPGFEVHPYYKDFSAPYMDADHGMMAGGAWASTGTSGSKYYRLWFRRGFIQHAGFRMAKDH